MNSCWALKTAAAAVDSVFIASQSVRYEADWAVQFTTNSHTAIERTTNQNVSDVLRKQLLSSRCVLPCQLLPLWRHSTLYYSSSKHTHCWWDSLIRSLTDWRGQSLSPLCSVTTFSLSLTFCTTQKCFAGCSAASLIFFFFFCLFPQLEPGREELPSGFSCCFTSGCHLWHCLSCCCCCCCCYLPLGFSQCCKMCVCALCSFPGAMCSTELINTWRKKKRGRILKHPFLLFHFLANHFFFVWQNVVFVATL